MPLDMSQFTTTTTDTPEVAALKAKVKTVATKYTNRHGWCEEVNKALKEIGIDDEKTITIGVSLDFLPEPVKTTILPSLLAGLDDDAQRAAVAAKLKTIRYAVGSDTGEIPVTFANVTDVSLWTPPSVAANDRPGDRWLFASDLGRSRHLYQNIDSSEGRTVWTVCNQSHYRSRLTDKHGENPDARCVECIRRAARRT